MLEGILHAVFLGNIKCLMPALIFVKIFMISNCLIYRKSFTSLILFLFSVIYFGFGVFIDAYIFYHYYIQKHYFSGEKSEIIHDKIEMSLPLALLTLILLKTFLSIIFLIYKSLSKVLCYFFQNQSQIIPTSNKFSKGKFKI
jgi:hypothetical protein